MHAGKVREMTKRDRDRSARERGGEAQGRVAGGRTRRTLTRKSARFSSPMSSALIKRPSLRSCRRRLFNASRAICAASKLSRARPTACDRRWVSSVTGSGARAGTT